AAGRRISSGPLRRRGLGCSLEIRKPLRRRSMATRFFLRWLRRKEVIAPKWQHNVGSCTSAPLISAETVIGFAFAGQSDRIVVCGLDKDLGSQKWKVELPGNPHPPAAAAVGDFLFFAPVSRSILRIDTRNGSVQTFDIGADLSVAAENLWVTSAPGAAIFGYGKSYWRSRINSDTLELMSSKNSVVIPRSPHTLPQSGRRGICCSIRFASIRSSLALLARDENSDGILNLRWRLWQTDP